MAGSKEIRSKIKSVENTRKITKAMEMVAASKMRKAQDRMRAARPYGDKIRSVTANLSHANPEYRHVFMQKRTELKRVGVIMVTSDKGLCGGLNTNAMRLMVNKIKEWEGAGAKVQGTAIGNKGFGFLQRYGIDLVSHAVGLGDKPHLEQLIGPIKIQLDQFAEGKIDALYLCYTKFINTMRQEAVCEQLLPLSGEKLGAPDSTWDYMYEPDPKAVLDELMVRYIEALIYQAVSENIASEQSARMVAMKAASDNAKKVIGELKLSYNKARQAAITKELSEIVSGAAAV
ncbi:MAG: F0F1 ATP synthase subunit gamma [Burkholderiales bacterium]|jgi:F-type H+-transporting ATPase subunit gamma|nr:F0F1 ATP synthase subunit gamma [Nitrosomonadaceae bacterium]